MGVLSSPVVGTQVPPPVRVMKIRPAWVPAYTNLFGWMIGPMAEFELATPNDVAVTYELPMSAGAAIWNQFFPWSTLLYSRNWLDPMSSPFGSRGLTDAWPKFTIDG